MGAPVGNQFWKQRSKHGRDKIFTDPKVLLEACYEYFDYQTNNRQWIKNEAIKGGEFTGQIIHVPTATPFSEKLLCIFLHVHSKYLNEFEKGLKPKENEVDKDFSEVILHVREIIQGQQFEGAAVGAFKENIISRTLGLADKSDVKHDGLMPQIAPVVNVYNSGPPLSGAEDEIDDDRV